MMGRGLAADLLMILWPLLDTQPDTSSADYCIERGAIINNKGRLTSAQRRAL